MGGHGRKNCKSLERALVMMVSVLPPRAGPRASQPVTRLSAGGINGGAYRRIDGDGLANRQEVRSIPMTIEGAVSDGSGKNTGAWRKKGR